MCRILLSGMVLVATVFLLCGTSVAGRTNFVEVGGAGNGSTDDTTAIRTAVTAAVALSVKNPTVFFRGASGAYRVTDTIVIPANISVVMESPMVYDHTDDEPCLVIGGSTDVSFRCTYKLRVVKDTQSDWDSEDCIGIKIYNANACSIQIVEATGFTIGVQCIGISDKGFVHNRFSLGKLTNNKVSLDLTNSDDGWCRENVFLNGLFSNGSSTNLTKSRYGVRITSEDETADGNNNNLFIRPSFELGLPYDPNEAVPILIEYGSFNKFESCRDEDNSDTFARVQNDSQGNEFHLGFGDKYIDCIDDQTALKDSTFTLRANAVVQQPKKLVYSSGPLHKKVGHYNNDPDYHVPGLHIGSSGTASYLIADSGLTIGADYLTIPSTKGVGGIVDTQLVKRFVLTRQVEEDYEGQLVIRCYDASDDVLADPNVAYVSPLDYDSSFGGSYIQDGDSGEDVYFCVTDDVKKIAVMVAGGTSDLRIRSFSLFSIARCSTSLISDTSTPFPDANVATVAPTGGTWKTGRIFYNAEPATGEFVGWLCTSGGSPGTWLGFGAIE